MVFPHSVKFALYKKQKSFIFRKNKRTNWEFKMVVAPNGYRLLKKNEVIQQDDKYFCVDLWLAIPMFSRAIGSKWNDYDWKPFCRKKIHSDKILMCDSGTIQVGIFTPSKKS